MPAVGEHLTANYYVDQSISTSVDEPTLVRNNQVNDYNNYYLNNVNFITLHTQAVNDNQVITKAYGDQFHNDNERNRRDLGINFYNESSNLVKINQHNIFNDKKLTNFDSITVISNPSSDNELPTKKTSMVDDFLVMVIV